MARIARWSAVSDELHAVSSWTDGPVMPSTYDIRFAGALGMDAKLPSVLMAPYNVNALFRKIVHRVLQLTHRNLEIACAAHEAPDLLLSIVDPGVREGLGRQFH